MLSLFLWTKIFLEIRPLLMWTFINFPDASQNKLFVQWAGLPESFRIQSLSEWHIFLRKVTFHAGRVTKCPEYKLMPSYNALINHCLRACYVLKLVYCVATPVVQH